MTERIICKANDEEDAKTCFLDATDTLLFRLRNSVFTSPGTDLEANCERMDGGVR